MHDPLHADALMVHIQALADEIGPRPPGHPEEAQAREYIRTTLAAMGYAQVEELPFQTIDDPSYSFFCPLTLSVAGALLGELGGRKGKLVGALAALYAAASYWCWTGGGRQPLIKFAPQYPSATLLLRIAPKGTVRRRAVLIGHTDTQKAYPLFRPEVKRQMLGIYTQILAMMLVTGVTLPARSAGLRPAALASWASLLMHGNFMWMARPGTPYPFVDGANDNATAVACLLGLAAALRQEPLRETEVWVAFTGAEEVGLLGTHRLLDAYGDQLRDAQFIDFEMVGSDEIGYVTRHSGLTYLSSYQPDPASLALAERAAAARPDLRVRGRDLVILEEIGALRRRGFGGLCIVGVGPDGWLENWHLPSDVSAQIKPDGVERAARFGLELLRQLDGTANMSA